MINPLSAVSNRIIKHLKSIAGRKAPSPQLRMTRLFDPDEIIPVPALDTSFTLMHAGTELEQAWMDVLNKSGEFGVWDDGRLARVMLTDLLPECGIVVLDENNKGIACSAVCMKKNLKPLAVLMNVIVLPEYRGRGISSVMVSDSLAQCQRLDIPGVTLLTDDYRLPAIGLYLKLGFKPDLTASSDAPVRWKHVLARLHGDQR